MVNHFSYWWKLPFSIESVFEIIKYVYLNLQDFNKKSLLKWEEVVELFNTKAYAKKFDLGKICRKACGLRWHIMRKYKVIHLSLFESLLTKRSVSLSLGSSLSQTTGVINSLAAVQLLTSDCVCVSHSRVCIRCRSWRAAAISWRSW